MRRRGIIVVLVALFALALVPSSPAQAEPELKWVPTQGLRWQYQLQGKINTKICTKVFGTPKGTPCVRPDVYVIDLYNHLGTALNTVAVDAIHTLGKKAVCYVSAGSYENWRPDASAYPAGVLAHSNGWPGERWVDIRQIDVLRPILEARADKCVEAGFDAIDWDNVDGYTNNTGLPLTGADQLAFNTAIADIAHDRGLAVGLKNDLEQLAALKDDFEFAVNEQCHQYQECGWYDDWIAAGKPVLQIEYTGTPKKICAPANLAGRDTIKKSLKLTAGPWVNCH
jgi:hypothetical protein